VALEVAPRKMENIQLIHIKIEEKITGIILE